MDQPRVAASCNIFKHVQASHAICLFISLRRKGCARVGRIAGELRNLPEGSAELRAAHANLQNIRRALALPSFQPG
jgi:hypothetical protein